MCGGSGGEERGVIKSRIKEERGRENQTVMTGKGDRLKERGREGRQQERERQQESERERDGGGGDP